MQLGDGGVEAAGRDEGIADEPVRRHRAVLLGQPGVVSLHDGQVDLLVADRLDETGHEDRSEQDLSVDTVDVLLVETLNGVTRAFPGRAVLVEVAGVGELHRPPPLDVLAVVQHGLAFDQPSVGTIR